MYRGKRALTTPQFQKEDGRFENTLRPLKMDEFVGQSKVKQKLEIFIKAALERGDPLDHTLLYGPPGLGKTTLAHIIAHEMGKNIYSTSGSAIDRPGELAKILTNTQLQNGDILFIDEIHRLHPQVEEVLYSAMEDFKVDIILGKGASTRSVKIPLSRFTLIGATTRAGLLTSPLRNRFGVISHLDFYNEDELFAIVIRSSHILGVKIEEEGAREIARRSRGTPRVANRILRRVRDYAQIKGEGIITREIAQKALTILEIDEKGLDVMDRKILQAILYKFGGGPVGIKTLAMAVNEEPDTIEEVYEPYLLREGLINRTPRGRVATTLLYEYLNKTPPSSLQQTLPF
ncbi:Holliday junction branch migration DNA helicase RuvB [Candidatus Aerophobetes bacterium]|uniref:Holliday junction branch migration complex subunit RuvB n=1 Tax=Aerophobetes bacterium TaxID=2030807 RepID=A0A662DFL3_UNCAE|nr:MAG: Holliday junction branch migration DNA helicase RuvB [Candidatus Aerophobetes bacterium]